MEMMNQFIWIFQFILTIVFFVFPIFLLYYFSKLVVAVEKIADKLDGGTVTRKEEAP